MGIRPFENLVKGDGGRINKGDHLAQGMSSGIGSSSCRHLDLGLKKFFQGGFDTLLNRDRPSLSLPSAEIRAVIFHNRLDSVGHYSLTFLFEKVLKILFGKKILILNTGIASFSRNYSFIPGKQFILSGDVKKTLTLMGKKGYTISRFIVSMRAFDTGIF